MANEIIFPAPSVATYAAYILSAGQVWNGSTFATITAGAKASGAVTMTRQGTTLDYLGTIPAGINTARVLTVEIFESDGSPDGTEPAVASGVIVWSGSAEIDAGTLSAYIDTEVGAIKAKTDNLPNDPADASDIATAFTTLTTAIAAGVTLTSGERATLAGAILDLSNGVETGETLRQTMRLLRSILAGDRVAGVFKRKDGTTTAATATIDEMADTRDVTIGTLT